MVLFLFFMSVVSVQAKWYQLSWTPGAEPDIKGYRTFARSDGDVYDYDFPMWDGETAFAEPFDTASWADGTYMFVVRAYDRNGNESADSNECILPLNGGVDLPPGAPGG